MPIFPFLRFRELCKTKLDLNQFRMLYKATHLKEKRNLLPSFLYWSRDFRSGFEWKANCMVLINDGIIKPTLSFSHMEPLKLISFAERFKLLINNA